MTTVFDDNLCPRCGWMIRVLWGGHGRCRCPAHDKMEGIRMGGGVHDGTYPVDDKFMQYEACKGCGERFWWGDED